MMQQRMPRTLLTLVVLFAACKGGKESAHHGPSLTPILANQLRAIAPDCEVKQAQGARGTKELRLCQGPHGMVTIHLDDKRNLIEVEIGVFAPILEDAKLVISQAVKGFASDAALTALTDRLKNTKSDPVVIDGTRVDAFYTQQKPTDSPRFTAVLAW